MQEIDVSDCSWGKFYKTYERGLLGDIPQRSFYEMSVRSFYIS